MAQLILSSKPENLGSDPLQPQKKSGVAVHICDAKQEDPLCLLVSQPNPIGEFPVQGETLAQNLRWGVTEISGLHMHVHICVPVFMGTHMYTLM